MTTDSTRRPDLEILPLGGLGEFGMNTMQVSCGSVSILIDAGALFPDHGHFGIDLIVPDLTALRAREQRFSALVLTHGHEDHIGGVPYLWDLLDGPVYGTTMTLSLLEPKLEEHGIDPGGRLTPVLPGEPVQVGPLSIEFIHVTHNLPGCAAVAVHSPAGTIVHSGDYKFDPTPLDGQPTDSRRFAELGRAGVIALLGDSTNADQHGVTGSERDVVPAFEDIFARTRGKLIVTSFASSLYRVQLLVDLATKFGRKVAIVGRGLVQNTSIAERLGHLSIPAGRRVLETDISSMDADKVLCLVTGSQGEARAALSRIATDRHRHIKLQPDDVVIFSARAIPGNQRAIAALKDNVTRRGATVIDQHDSRVHVSGHGSSEELKLLLSLVRPKHFVPIHGEYRCLVRHAQLANTVMRGDTDVVLLENGEPLCFDAAGAWRGEPVATGRVPINRSGMEKLVEPVLRDRRRLASDGIVVVMIAVQRDAEQDWLPKEPEVVTRGLTAGAKLEALLKELPQMVAATMQDVTHKDREDYPVVEERIRTELQGFVRRRTGQRPLVVPVIVEV